MENTLNLNVGILGHVDSGKTSLAKRISQIASTASFDKNPQSQERGITIDLGFSSLKCPIPDHLKGQNDKLKHLQFTFVDCPGHASLLRTVIGGAQIIDMIILVLDICKGIQTQTAECLVLGEVTCNRMLIVLNKIDMIPEEKRASTIQKVSKKMQLTLKDSVFKDSPIVSLAANPGGSENSTQIPVGIDNLIEVLKGHAVIPERSALKPFLFAVDHCFGIRGQGTVLTGTVLQGSVSVGDIIEIPSLKLEKKVKSMQMFRQNVTSAHQGDRLGICVKQLDSNHLERGIICAPSYSSTLHAAIIPLNVIKYFKSNLRSNSKFHISVGYETVIGRITIFRVCEPQDYKMESKKSTPDTCDSCNKPFEKKKNKRVTIRREIDPVSNKLLRLCNSCGLRFFRARWRVKKERAKVVSQDEKDNYKLEVEEFSKLVNEIVNDEEIARRLGCPVATPKICRCIQRYLTMDNKFSGDLRTCTLSLARTKELQESCKSAKDLIQTRETSSSDSMNEQKSVNTRPKLRSKDYEEYVFANRTRLKEECSLCERGCQRVLCYSNNFLHKQLKSNSKNEARVLGKHTNLLPLSQLPDYKCCKQRCTGMAAAKSDWHQLVFTWRKRALACQREARQVLAEMCRPAGNRTTNCRQFIKQVTGCSDGLLAKVRKELKQSLGYREPAEHGLKEYWRQKKIKAASKRGPAKEVNTRVAAKLNEVVKERRIEVLKGGTKVMAGSTRIVTANTKIIAGNTKVIGGNNETVRPNSTLSHLKNLQATPNIANSLIGATTSLKNLQPTDKRAELDTTSRIRPTTSPSKYSTNKVFTRAEDTSNRQPPTPVVSKKLKTADTYPQTADSNRRITDIVLHSGETSVDSNEKSLGTAECSRGSVSGNQLILSAYEDADSLQVSEEAEQIEIIKIIEGNSCDQFSDTDCSRLVYMTPDGMSVFEFPK